MVCALGGMIFPVLFFIHINLNTDTARDWCVQMATNIAFALTILKLLGEKLPKAIKIFLTAFTIIDYMGAVLSIAIFYSGSI